MIRPSDGLVHNVIYDIEVEPSGRVRFAGLTAIGTFDPIYNMPVWSAGCP